MGKTQIGVIGLAVMGRNLALNITDHGYSVVVYNRSREKTDELLSTAEGARLQGAYSIEEFVDALEVPRKIILMVKAGAAVDSTVSQLLPFLAKGDVVVDGGNSFYKDTIRRSKELEAQGISFIGMGISGGEEGARYGPAIMPGGDVQAYQLVELMLLDICAKVDGEACCTHIGTDGAGHFVKMVHNGIEYADMQLISEAYALLKQAVGLTAGELHDVFRSWSEGELSSYLIDITADIFAKQDDETGLPLVDVILDVSEQKGTGRWTSQIALELGAAVPTIAEAVFMRALSTFKEERVFASSLLPGPADSASQPKAFIESVRRALYCSKMCAYAQGFSLLNLASQTHGWALDLGGIAKIFRGGCIIRAKFLNSIHSAYSKNNALPNLLLDDFFSTAIGQYQQEWREVVKTAVERGIPVPAFSSALSYYDSYRSAVLPANLLQAQRDYFGAHTYRRTDKEGAFHTIW